MKISKFLVVLIVCSALNFLYAQEEEMCGVENLTAAERQALWEAQSNWLATGNRGLTESVTIPIAFHIVHSNGVGNVSDQDIYNQLDVLNATFSNTNFSFSIYTINRVNNPYWSNHDSPDSHAAVQMKVNLAINPTEILNFYICNNAGGMSGYANYPWTFSNEPWEHCVVIKYTTLPEGSHPNYNEGKVGTHEVGHFFGLFHVFEDGCDPESPDDLVTDTPKQAFYTRGCPDPIPDTCPNDPGLDNIHNYMDYSDDYCKYEFTPGQIDRMHQQMLMYRPIMLGIENGVYVSQIRESGSLMIGSKIHYYNTSGSVFDEYLIPAPYFDLEPDAIETFRGTQELIFNPVEKFYIWKENVNDYDIINHSPFWIDEGYNFFTSQFKKTYSGVTIKNNIDGFDIGTIGFKDPWLIDYPDPEYPKPEGGYYKRNRGMEPYGPDALIFKDKPSPFTPDYTTNYDGDVHQGVFLNQGEDWIPPYYSVKAPSTFYNPQTGKTHQLYFLGWDYNPNKIGLRYPQSSETAVVFKDDNAELTAKLKGTQISSNTNAFASTSQRKFVRTNDGVMYNLYESLNRVWLEKSTDNGSTWSIINNGNPLKNADSRNPSMCLTYYNGLIIVFETEGLIWIYEYNPATNIAYERTSIYSCTISPYQSNPVVTYCFNDNASVTGPVVIWKSYGNDAFCGNAGLYYAMINADNWTASPEIIITNTDINSFDPSIAGNDPIHSEATWKGDPMKFNLVWEQRGSVNSSIMFYQVERLANNTLQFTQYQNISSGNGFTKNYKPSLITVKNVLGEFKSRVVWLAERYQAEEDRRTEKGQGTENTEGAQYKTFFKDVGISGFRSYGNKTNAPTINKLNDNSEYYLAYSEQSNLEGKVVIGSDYTAINDLETIGRDIQMGNGTTENQVRALAFHSAELPFYFNRSASMNHVSPKRKSLAIVSGREGVVGKDTAQFYFTVGDIIVNDENIEFVDLPDTAEINSIVTLNEYLLTNAFTLNDNSVFYYSVQYGIADSSSAIQAMTDSIFINFTVQLLDAGTDEIIGTFDNVTYNSDSVFIYNNIAYQVNVSGLNNRLVKLRLKTETNHQFDYSLTQRYAEESVLGKKFIKQINFNAGVAVTEYALEQNYPNPFNPSTTIRYQIPQDGMVTLKVYDILGSEVATLVNEQKAAGRYEVNFDASRLASGVYIYKLQAGEYVSSKKMLLVK